MAMASKVIWTPLNEAHVSFLGKKPVLRLGDSSDGTFLGAQTDLEKLLVPGVDLLEPGATRFPDFGIFHDFGRSKPTP